MCWNHCLLYKLSVAHLWTHAPLLGELLENKQKQTWNSMFLLKSQEVSLLNYFYQDFISLWVLRMTSFWKVGPGRGEWESTYVTGRGAFWWCGARMANTVLFSSQLRGIGSDFLRLKEFWGSFWFGWEECYDLWGSA